MPKRLDDQIDRARSEREKRELEDARWGRGPRAGKTGDVFVDDPFFNPWAPGGSFDRSKVSGPRRSRGSRFDRE